MPVRRLLVLSAGVFLLVSACALAPLDDFDISPVPPEVTTSAFPDGGDIPVEYTCDGDDISPPLSWDTHPDAVEVVLVFEDLNASGGTFSHWLVAGLPTVGSISAGELPNRAVEGTNDFGDVGYRGPCPPPDDGPHTYRLEMIDVAEPTGLAPGFTRDDLDAATSGTQLSSGNVSGHYGR